MQLPEHRLLDLYQRAGKLREDECGEPTAVAVARTDLSGSPASVGSTSQSESIRNCCSERNNHDVTTAILTRSELEAMGPLVPEELTETGVAEASCVICALKHVAYWLIPTTTAVASNFDCPDTDRSSAAGSYREN